MIETGRLILRRWRDDDRPAFHAHCSDPDVMRYLGPPLTRAETDAALDRQNGYLESHGYCFWAVERRADGALLGFCGLKPGAPGTPIEGMVEIGWRFGRAFWGQGYAREAAVASLDWGWANLDASHIVAITVLANERSWGLMERLGMQRVADGDFDHPTVPDDSPLKRHITYSIARPA
ncbi:GNAT family N-acetyltransferase [Sphingomonas sp. DT-204]|uniref:GNAT family N-acetyltransferase n=1 Tax=Sphingomonas sp. DT-204 TaxID=3396166 RepID=UPI003F19EF7B